MPCKKRESLLQIYISALHSHNLDVREHTAVLGTAADTELVAAAVTRVETSRKEYIAARESYITHLREHGCDQLPGPSGD